MTNLIEVSETVGIIIAVIMILAAAMSVSTLDTIILKLRAHRAGLLAYREHSNGVRSGRGSPYA